MFGIGCREIPSCHGSCWKVATFDGFAGGFWVRLTITITIASEIPVAREPDHRFLGQTTDRGEPDPPIHGLGLAGVASSTIPVTARPRLDRHGIRRHCRERGDATGLPDPGFHLGIHGVRRHHGLLERRSGSIHPPFLTLREPCFGFQESGPWGPVHPSGAAVRHQLRMDERGVASDALIHSGLVALLTGLAGRSILVGSTLSTSRVVLRLAPTMLASS